MSDDTFTFRVDQTLKCAFNAAAKANDRSGAQILRGAMRDFVMAQTPAPVAPPADGWLPAKVEKARASLVAGNGYDEEAMKARFARVRAAARAAADVIVR